MEENHLDQNQKTKKLIERILRDWKKEDSQGYKYLISKFGPKPNRVLLLAIANVIHVEMDIKLEREAQRNKNVLIKWYDDHLDVVKDLFENKKIKVTDKEGNVIFPVVGNE